MIDPMTKQQEIDTLNAAIKKLGNDSYLGPWLNQVKFEVEAMVRSDFFPALSLSDSAKQCAEIIQDAKQQSDKIIQSAVEKASSVKKRQDEEMRSEVQRVLRVLHTANKEIENTVTRLQ